MATRETVFGVCNWLMVGIALAMCAYVFTDMFSPPSQSEGTPLARQKQYRVSIPTSAVTSSPSKVEAKSVSALVPNGSAGRQPQPAGGRGLDSESPEVRFANAPYVSGPSAPIPNMNRHLLPPGMENEDNSLSNQPRPKK